MHALHLFLCQKTKSQLPESICNKKKQTKRDKATKKTICLKLLHFHQYLTLINKQHVQMVSSLAHQLQLCWEISQELQYKQTVMFIIQEVICFRKKRKKQGKNPTHTTLSWKQKIFSFLYMLLYVSPHTLSRKVSCSQPCSAGRVQKF